MSPRSREGDGRSGDTLPPSTAFRKAEAETEEQHAGGRRKPPGALVPLVAEAPAAFSREPMMVAEGREVLAANARLLALARRQRRPARRRPR